TWQKLAGLLVLFVFIRQAAQQTATQTRHLRRVEREVLVLRHPHGNVRIDRQPRTTAQCSPALAETANQARFVPRSDHLHLDLDAKLLGEHSAKVLDEGMIGGAAGYPHVAPVE